MQTLARNISGTAAALSLRIADATPALLLYGPTAALAALLTAWLASLRWSAA